MYKNVLLDSLVPRNKDNQMAKQKVHLLLEYNKLNNNTIVKEVYGDRLAAVYKYFKSEFKDNPYFSYHVIKKTVQGSEVLGIIKDKLRRVVMTFTEEESFVFSPKKQRVHILLAYSYTMHTTTVLGVYANRKDTKARIERLKLDDTYENSTFHVIAKPVQGSEITTVFNVDTNKNHNLIIIHNTEE